MRLKHNSSMCQRCLKRNERGEKPCIISSTENTDYTKHIEIGGHLWFQKIQFEIDCLMIINRIQDVMTLSDSCLTSQIDMDSVRIYFEYVLLYDEHPACWNPIVKESLWRQIELDVAQMVSKL